MITTNEMQIETELDFKYEIQRSSTRENLLLSDQYLTLSKPIVKSDGTKIWRDIATYWETVIQNIADDVRGSKEKSTWMSSFSEDCEQCYDSYYRKLGVINFYEEQRNEIKGYASFIRRHIGEKLFYEWQSSAKSIIETEQYLSLLVNDCEERLPKFKERIAQIEYKLEQAIVPELKRLNCDWCNIGWLKDYITGASKKIFSGYVMAKCQYYIFKTQIEGFRYAFELMQVIITELDALLKNKEEFELLFKNHQ